MASRHRRKSCACREFGQCCRNRLRFAHWQKPWARRSRGMSSSLVVDDDDQFRRMVQRTLERAGFEVRAASNGRQALEIFNQHGADLVLTDLIMPECEGLETIVALRR